MFSMPPPPPEYCLFWIDWWPLCMTKSEWSGWMQAAGAVFAIAMTGFAVHRAHVLQERHQQQISERAYTHFLESTWQLLGRAATIAASAIDFAEGVGDLHYSQASKMRAELEPTERTLRQINVMEYRDYEATRIVLVAQTLCTQLLVATTPFKSELGDPFVKTSEVTDRARDLKRILCGRAMILRNMIVERGGKADTSVFPGQLPGDTSRQEPNSLASRS